MRLAEARVPRGGLMAAALALASAGLLVYFSRRLTFFSDEWTFISELPGAPARYYLEPHNEHWSTLPKLIYGILLPVFGLRSYAPYMAALAALHATAALCLYGLIRRRSGELLALASLPLFLFMGRGFENLLWANQVGFVGSVAAGLAALLLLDRPECSGRWLAPAALLLVIGLMFSGVGLIFLAAAGLELFVDRQRRPMLAVLAPPLAAYTAWYLLFGRAAVSVHRNPFTAEALTSLVGYVPTGPGAAVAGLAGLSESWSAWGFAALASATAAAATVRRRLEPGVLGAAAGLLALFVLAGLVRGQLGAGQAGSSRYVYIAGAFALLLLTDAVRDLEVGRRWRFVLAAVVTVASVHSLQVLVGEYRSWAARSATQQAELQTLGAVSSSPDLDRNVLVDPGLAVDITIGDYLRVATLYGPPAPAVEATQLAGLPPAAVDQALRRGFASKITVDAAGQPSSCQVVNPAIGFADVPVAQGGSVVFVQALDSPVDLYIWYAGDPPTAPTASRHQLPPYTRLRLPDAGLPGRWQLRVQPAVGLVPSSVCNS